MADGHASQTARYCLLAAGAACVVMFALWLGIRQPRERPLMKRATRIDTPSYPFPYWWAAPDRLVTAGSEGGRTIVRYDVRTRAVEPLARLNRWLAGRPVSLHLSPDGTLLLFCYAPHNRKRPALITYIVGVVAVEGTMLAARSEHATVDGWLGDGRRWIACDIYGAQPARHVYDVNDREVARLSAPPPGSPELLGSVAGDRVAYADSAGAGVATVCDCPATTGSAWTCTTIRVPPSARVDQVELSPDGRRLAWKVEDDRVGAVRDMLYRLLNRSVDDSFRDAIWTSRLDGTDMREAGWAPVSRQDPGDSDLSNLQWTPDGRALSFVYRDHLYRVPAD